MARRGYIGGERRGFQINPIEFLRGGGGGDDKGDTTMAMALMGYGKGGPQAQALDERQQAALELFQQGQLANMAEQRRIDELKATSEAAARTAATTDTAEQRKVAAQNELQRQKEAAANLDYLKTAKQQETTERLIGDLMQHGQMTAADPRLAPLLERTSPGFKADMQEVAAADREKQITEGLAKYQKATPKEKQAYTKTPASLATPDIYDEILKRANVNVAQPQGTATAPSEGRLPLSRFAEQNVPTAPPSDVFSEAGVRIGLPSVDARDYSKFPGSVEDLIAASKGSMQARGGQVIPEQDFTASPMTLPSFDIPSAPILGGGPMPGGAGILDEMLRKIRGQGEVGSAMPPIPSQGVFQPFPG